MREDGRPCADVSVRILSYNRPKFLREALDSVLAQTVRPMEIVILDNGSEPSVRAAIDKFLGRDVVWRGSETNRGVYWNFRRAIHDVTRKYLFIMHDDDRLLPSFLNEQVRFLERDDRLIAVASNAYVVDSEGRRAGTDLCDHGNDDTVLRFNNAAELALHYSTSFIPFPSIMYRMPHPAEVDPRGEFGKVWDSVYLCNLADRGIIAYRNKKLMEYRRHSDQDSVVFPEEVLRKVEEFYIQIGVRHSEEMRKRITRNVARRQAQRLICTWRPCVKGFGLIRNTPSMVCSFCTSRAGTVELGKIMIARMFRRFVRALKGRCVSS